MRFRNAFHITLDNFSSAFKMLLYRLVVAVITFSIVYVILRLALAVIVESAEWETLRGMTEEFFRALFSGDSAVLQTFQSDFHTALADFFALLGRNGGADLHEAHADELGGSADGEAGLNVAEHQAHERGADERLLKVQAAEQARVEHAEHRDQADENRTEKR